jgi:hypothetical protein
MLMEEVREAYTGAEIIMQSLNSLIVITEMESDNIVFMNRKFREDFHLDDMVIGDKRWKPITQKPSGRQGDCIYLS